MVLALTSDDVHVLTCRARLLEGIAGTVVDCNKTLVLAVGHGYAVRRRVWGGERFKLVLLKSLFSKCTGCKILRNVTDVGWGDRPDTNA